MSRRTRIVATLGPATDRPGVLEQLIAMGLDVARINFSHGAGEESLARMAQLRELAKKAGRHIAILADLPGPKLRASSPAHPINLEPGQTLTIALKPDVSGDARSTEPEVMNEARPGQRILFDDGRLQGRISDCSPDVVVLRMEVGGQLLPNKGVNLPDTGFHIPALTLCDLEAIAVAARAKVDWVVLLFVRNAAAAQELRNAARQLRLDAPILAKIERPEAVAKADEIIDAFDGIMVVRGDLGVEIALEKVPPVQKMLIAKARAAGKPVITATDMLDSMREPAHLCRSQRRRQCRL